MSQTGGIAKNYVRVLTGTMSEANLSPVFPTAPLTSIMSATIVVGDIILVNSDIKAVKLGHNTCQTGALFAHVFPEALIGGW